jgi:hypothetical protein
MLLWTVRGSLHRGDPTDEASYLLEDIDIFGFKAIKETRRCQSKPMDVTVGRHIEKP